MMDAIESMLFRLSLGVGKKEPFEAISVYLATNSLSIPSHTCKT